MQSPTNYFTVEDYLALEQTCDLRHEYVDGEIFAMAGASEEHNLIVTNIISLLRPHLRKTPCRAFASDMKVKVKAAKADIFYYPDLFVTCDSSDNEKYFKTRPCLIIEVLSDSTETIDKREKRTNYRTLDSLQEYVLVSQNKIQVEVYSKDFQGKWLIKIFNNSDDLIDLKSINLTLTMSEIYEDTGLLLHGKP